MSGLRQGAGGRCHPLPSVRHEFRNGGKAKQTFQPLQRHWDTGWSFRARLTSFIIIESVALGFELIGVLFLGSDP